MGPDFARRRELGEKVAYFLFAFLFVRHDIER